MKSNGEKSKRWQKTVRVIFKKAPAAGAARSFSIGARSAFDITGGGGQGIFGFISPATAIRHDAQEVFADLSRTATRHGIRISCKALKSSDAIFVKDNDPGVISGIVTRQFNVDRPNQVEVTSGRVQEKAAETALKDR